MAYSFRHTDPRLSGTIVEEMVLCGRENCHCHHLGPIHGPYSYLYWRDNGIMRKEYMTKNQVKPFREAIRSKKDADLVEKHNLRAYSESFNSLISKTYE